MFKKLFPFLIQIPLVAVDFSCPDSPVINIPVTSSLDPGTGTLREALTTINATGGVNNFEIDFDIGANTIHLSGPLPTVNSHAANCVFFSSVQPVDVSANFLALQIQHGSASFENVSFTNTQAESSVDVARPAFISLVPILPPLAITGDLDINGGILFELNNNKASQINVTGTATLTGPIVVSIDGVNNTNSFPIVSAGDLKFSFSNQSVLPPNCTLQQRGNILYLVFQSPAISTSQLSGKNAAFANYLNQNSPAAAALLAPLSGSTLNHALALTSPARNANTIASIENSVLQLNNASKKSAQTKRNNNAACSVASFDAAENYENLLADATEDLTSLMSSFRKPTKSTYGVSVIGIGDYSHQIEQQQMPSYKTYSGGALLAFEYYDVGEGLIGANAGYSYSHVKQAKDSGSANINQGFSSIYGLFVCNQFYADLAVSGGVNNTKNRRNIFFPDFNAVAKSSIHNWQLLPHLELGYDFIFDSWGIEPYGSVDWVSNWQGHYRETGGGVFDMIVKSHHSSLLRSEAGLRFYEFWKLEWGWIFLREVVGYINKEFYGTGSMDVAIVGASNFFSIDTTSKPQNLCSNGVELVVIPNSRKYPYASFSYYGEIGAPYQSYQGMVRLIKKF